MNNNKIKSYNWAYIFGVFVLIPLFCVWDVFVWQNPTFFQGLANMQVVFFLMTLFTHRYFSHRAFKMPYVSERIVAFLCSTIFQNDPLWWASNHRLHHKRADTAEDVHSPHTHGFWDANFLWSLRKENLKTDFQIVKDLTDRADLLFYNRHPWFGPIVMTTLLMTFFYWLGYFHFNETTQLFNFAAFKNAFHWTVWLYLLPGLVSLLSVGLSNTLIHSWGYQDYATGDESRNNPAFALIMAGEGWHNNHHKYPERVHFSHKWWQLDLGYWAYRLLKFVRFVH